MSPLVTMGRPKFAPKNYPFPLTDPQIQLPASSLNPFDLPSQAASVSAQPFFHSPLDRHTDPHTDRQTDRWLLGKFDHYSLLMLYRQQRGLKMHHSCFLLLNSPLNNITVGYNTDSRIKREKPWQLQSLSPEVIWFASESSILVRLLPQIVHVH